jgi:hypothetical protein
MEKLNETVGCIENPRVDGSIPPLATRLKSPNPFRAFSRLP